jgi:hypothetical protein
MRILRDITFNETEIATSINIIEKASDISNADIADVNDTNIIFENIENTPFENITVEPAPVRRSIRYRKAIFKIVEANAMTANVVEVAETSIISADERESEEENYLPKIIIAKSFITNENKLTYEKAIADLEKFQ